jgi:BirA family biotin operon repressor/biotin-[acetyl-CoA-carboxylase] ligase
LTFAARRRGPAYFVVGIGINVRLPTSVRDGLRAEGVEATDLASLGEVPSRNEVAAVMIAELTAALVEFGGRGLAAFTDEWQEADALIGRPVRVLQGGQHPRRLARGVDGDGALMLETDGVRRRILSGDVSVRHIR